MHPTSTFLGPRWTSALEGLGRRRLRPDRPADPALSLPPAPADAPLSVTFLGASTALLTDGRTAVLTDGFFSRPPALRMLLGRIAPDPAVVERCLQRAGIEQVAAVVPLHTHYDHVLDAAEVCRRTGAVLVGSSSSAMVARGDGLADDRIVVPGPHRPLTFGRFTLTLVPSGHVRPDRFGGQVTAPLTPPAPVSAYRIGECYSLHVRHPVCDVLVQGSAGTVPGALQEYRAPVVYLAVGGLGRRPQAEFDTYWREVVTAVGARRVLLTHWDDLTFPLDRPLVPMPYLFDDLDATLRRVRPVGEATGVDVRLPTEWQPTNPVAELSPPAREDAPSPR